MTTQIKISDLIRLAVPRGELVDHYTHLQRLIGAGTTADDITQMYGPNWICVSIDLNPSLRDLIEKIPRHNDREMTGYIEDRSLTMICCDRMLAYCPSDRPIVFHTHPQWAEFADLPSEDDLFTFLMCPVQISITIGQKRIWTFVKTKETLALLKD